MTVLQLYRDWAAKYPALSAALEAAVLAAGLAAAAYGYGRFLGDR